MKGVHKKLSELTLLIVTNIIYSLVYVFFCSDSSDWNGIDAESDGTFAEKFMNRLYFSVVTFSTVGYGDISPKTQKARALVMTQILFNIVGMARLLIPSLF